jgi:hypothetical protein
MSIVIIIWYMLDFLIRFIVDKDGDKEEGIDNLIQFMRTYQASTRTLLSFMLVFYYQQVSESSKRGKERGTHFFSRLIALADLHPRKVNILQAPLARQHLLHPRFRPR